MKTKDGFFYVFMYLVMSYINWVKGKLFLDFFIIENNSILHQVKLWKTTLSHFMLNKKNWKITFQLILKLLPTKQKTKIWENLLLKKYSLFSKKMLMPRQRKHCCPGNFSNTHLQTGPTKKKKTRNTEWHVWSGSHCNYFVHIANLFLYLVHRLRSKAQSNWHVSNHKP